MDQAPRCAFVIFGISGDLAARKLMPALFTLHLEGALHPESHIVGYARSDYSDESLRQKLKEALQKYAKDFDEAQWAKLEPRIHYVRGGYDDPAGFDALKHKLDELNLENHAFYTSTPPNAYEGIVTCLANIELNRSSGWTRLIIEKPFGDDLASAQHLNKVVLEHFSEDQVYRIDHYLAKETAQNLSVLRFANTLFEPIWSNRYVDHVQITMAEPMGVEGRGGFYEEAGVIRDVFQNHLLQLLALVAMEPPSRYDAIAVRDEKVKVFRAMECLEPDHSVMGQYVARGAMKSYREEEGVNPDSRQATYAAAKFTINNWRWAGVPFYMRSGKRMPGKTTEIVLRLKSPPHIPFDVLKDFKADRLVMRLVPNEGISLRFNVKEPGRSDDMKRVSMNFFYDKEFAHPSPDAYETLLLDAMIGDATLFMRADEVEAQWRIVEPVLKWWEASDQEPAFYASGSWGPKEADRLLEQHGRYWHRSEDGKFKS
jgi:glucose-6-phosphate 1-dehydrogenase